MPLPAYPDEMTEAAWKKAAGPAYAKLEKSLGFGGFLAVLERKSLDKSEEKAFTELENAIKSKAGGDIITNYNLVGEALDKVEKLEAVTGEYAKMCKREGATLKADPETKKIGEWLLKAGPVATSYCETLKAFGEKLLEDAEKVPTEKIADLDWDLNDWDLTHLLTKVEGIKLDSIALPDKKMVTVSVTGKVGAQAAENAALRADFFEAAYDAAKKLAPALKKELEALDEEFNSGAVKGNDVPKRMEAAFDDFEKKYAKQADVAIQKVWSDYIKDKEEYKSYKIKTAVGIGAKVGGIAVGVIAIGSAGWTGVGTVLGLVALMKNAVNLARTLVTALQEARELYFEINDKLKELQAAYKDESKALIGTEEVAKDALARLTGIQLTTVTSVKSDMGTYGSKLKGCNVNATKMGADIDKALKEADALSAKLRKLKSELSGAKGVNINKLIGQYDKLMVEVGKLVAATANFKEDYLVGKKALIAWNEQIKDLEGEIPEIAKKIQKWGVPLLDFAFVTDGEAAITTTGSLLREFMIAATETEEELKDANEVGSLAVDVTVLVSGIIGK